MHVIGRIVLLVGVLYGVSHFEGGIPVFPWENKTKTRKDNETCLRQR